MILNCNYLIEKSGLKYPVIGLYDVPEPSAFEPLVKPSSGHWACAFMFFINPDQLSLFVIGAYYYHGTNDPPLVTATFASGCGMLLPCFKNLGQPEAIIGATDIAMRKYLPPDILAFTVTKPMYEQLCSLDEKSFLNKPFWKDLQKARKKS